MRGSYFVHNSNYPTFEGESHAGVGVNVDGTRKGAIGVFDGASELMPIWRVTV